MFDLSKKSTFFSANFSGVIDLAYSIIPSSAERMQAMPKRLGGRHMGLPTGARDSIGPSRIMKTTGSCGLLGRGFLLYT